MMHLRLARQQGIDHESAEPGCKISAAIIGNHCNAAGCSRRKPLRRCEPHQHLRVIDWSHAFDTKAVAVEQQREVAETHMVGITERRAVVILRKISRAIAQYYVAFAETQMSKKVLNVGDTLERAKHHDDIALRRSLG